MPKFRKLIFWALNLVVGLATPTMAQQAIVNEPSAPVAIPAGSPTAAELQQIVVTGYVVPRVGTGPAPVVTLDQDFIQKQWDQSVAEVVLNCVAGTRS